MRKIVLAVAALIAVVSLSACASGMPDPIGQLTPDQQAMYTGGA